MFKGLKGIYKHRAFLYFVLMIFICISFPLSAQDFEVEPDSLDGVGIRDEIHEFDSIITNLWDQQNRILWWVDTDIPEGWTLEVCQGTLLCWPPWVESDTLTIEAEAFDTLLIKFRTGPEDGVGSTTIHLIALADTTIHQEYTFTLRVGAQSIDEGNQPSADGRSFQFKPDYISSNGSMIVLPHSSYGTISLVDMQGRASSRIWTGHLQAGENFVNPDFSRLPAGQYILHLNVDQIGTLNRKIVILR